MHGGQSMHGGTWPALVGRQGGPPCMWLTHYVFGSKVAGVSDVSGVSGVSGISGVSGASGVSGISGNQAYQDFLTSS